MGRYIKNSNSKDRYKAKGIEFFEILDSSRPADCTYVLRISLEAAQPFVVGSWPTKIEPFGTGNQKRFYKQTVAAIGQKAGGVGDAYNVSVKGSDGKTKELIPIWVSNGTFFADDCSNPDNGQPIAKSYFMGPIVDSTRLFDPIWLNSAGQMRLDASGVIGQGGALEPAKKNRGIFLQKLSQGQTTIDFAQGPFSANDLVERGYSYAIGGAGILIQDGLVKPDNYGATAAGGSFETNGKGPLYCAGPVIAINESKTALYLIQDHTVENSNLVYPRAGRRWGQMGRYLRDPQDGTSEFLSEIRHEADGKIRDAIVYDGGGSRGLWVRDYNIHDNPVPHFTTSQADMSRRPVAHHLCVWGQPPLRDQNSD